MRLFTSRSLSGVSPRFFALCEIDEASQGGAPSTTTNHAECVFAVVIGPPKLSLALPYNAWNAHPSAFIITSTKMPWRRHRHRLLTGAQVGVDTGNPHAACSETLSIPSRQHMSLSSNLTLNSDTARAKVCDAKFQTCSKTYRGPQSAQHSQLASKFRAISSETTASFVWKWRVSHAQFLFVECLRFSMRCPDQTVR